MADAGQQVAGHVRTDHDTHPGHGQATWRCGTCRPRVAASPVSESESASRPSMNCTLGSTWDRRRPTQQATQTGVGHARTITGMPRLGGRWGTAGDVDGPWVWVHPWHTAPQDAKEAGRRPRGAAAAATTTTTRRHTYLEEDVPRVQVGDPLAVRVVRVGRVLRGRAGSAVGTCTSAEGNACESAPEGEAVKLAWPCRWSG